LPITSLPAYPLKYHPEKEELEKRLIERGKKWTSFDGIHHMRYDGTAFAYNEREPRVTVCFFSLTRSYCAH
jgi:hypothetical protein